MRKIEFWFELASTYSYITAMRIEALAAEAGVELVWRPFLLGPLFAAQGWTTSPFNLYEAKGRYMWRDMARRAEARGLPLRRPDPFPQNSLKAARLALVGLDETWGPAFIRAVYAAEFGEGLDISDEVLLTRLVGEAGGDQPSALAHARSEEIKARLRAATEHAAAQGIFGAPSFLVDGELFWGDDRLEDALAWAGPSPNCGGG